MQTLKAGAPADRVLEFGGIADFPGDFRSPMLLSMPLATSEWFPTLIARVADTDFLAAVLLARLLRFRAQAPPKAIEAPQWSRVSSTIITGCS